MYMLGNQKNSLLNGFIMLVIGLIIFNNPFGTLKVFLSILAFFILLWGIANFLSYRYTNAIKISQPWLLTQSIINIVFATTILLSLNVAVSVIMYMVGTYVMILSSLKIWQGIRERKYNIVNWQIHVYLGLLGLLSGILLFLFPEIIPMLLGTFLIFIGITKIVSALR